MTERQSALAVDSEETEKLTVSSSTVEGEPDEVIHLPGPSVLPLVLAVGMLLIAVGMVTFWAIAVGGLIVTMFAIVSWARPAAATASDALENTLAGTHGLEEAAGSNLNWWGMIWFLLTEAILFAFLIAAYLYIRAVIAPEWPPRGVEGLDVMLPSINTALLLSSSFPIHLASSGIRRGNIRRLQVGLVATILLGAIFLSLQLYEYSTMSLTPQQNVYGSVFFTLTGFHGFHVLIGLLILIVTFWHASRNRFTAQEHFGVQAAEMYWHFVDAVWVVLFVSLYIV